MKLKEIELCDNIPYLEHVGIVLPIKGNVKTRYKDCKGFVNSPSKHFTYEQLPKGINELEIKSWFHGYCIADDFEYEEEYESAYIDEGKYITIVLKKIDAEQAKTLDIKLTTIKEDKKDNNQLTFEL